MAKTLTSANSSLSIQIDGLYPIPQMIQGYATDDAFSSDDVASAEVQMGVDGHMSAGYVPVPRKLKIVLQADSDSMPIFDNLIAAQDASKEVYWANAVLSISGVGDKYAFTRGVLTNFTPLPASKKTLQPRSFELTFERASKAPN